MPSTEVAISLPPGSWRRIAAQLRKRGEHKTAERIETQLAAAVRAAQSAASAERVRAILEDRAE